MSSKSRFSPVSITGVGAISCAGADLPSFWQNALDEKSGLGEDALGLISHSPHATSPSLGKAASLALTAIREAMAGAGWNSLGPEDGLIIATTVGQMPLWDSELVQYLKQQIGPEEFGRALAHQPLGSLVEVLARLLGFKGRALLITSACSASTQAIGLAAQWVRQGAVKRCLVGGTEVLSRLTIEGFRSLQLLSAARARPFDQNRHGINLSEGAAFFCLEAESARTLASVAGMGFSTDAYHMAAPHPEGRGSFEAMRAAVSMAGLDPSQIDWVHAHGTGSKANDQSEGAAIAQLFGKDRAPWVSSTKAIHGHALGASGALETALCVQALRKQILLRTAGLEQPDAAIPIKHPSSNMPFKLRHILKSTLGFGGNNAALVLSRVEDA